VLRRPTESDREFHAVVHSDPPLYADAPHVVGTTESNAVFFEGILRDWREHGVGYWVAEDRASGMPLGWVGVRRSDGFPQPLLQVRHRGARAWAREGGG
jgi:hypothetical protein